ncbi:MAG: pyridoxal phosphate-dependent aminotransferase [Bacteroidetes bacterium]|nr:pyridoxal phosphate-dependent aminotransferase [Bacteroidota bacterium]MBU1113754.1 pyridoxal phosphate-dependent aminotransferase [Bacteroidota bacterium]MBU1800134.1 pyridoxal phosphate-dependent aminotransferase [Bacteroidota bacterium]
MHISAKVNTMEFSGTMQISGKAKELKAQGINVIDLSVGEPDFPTPQRIKDAAIVAMDKGHTGYTLASGIVPLREAVGLWIEKFSGVKYAANEIIISNGAKHSLYNTLQTIIEKGEEVIIPAPYWVTYPALVEIVDGIPVYIDTTSENDFKITPLQLKAAITDKTRAIILCNPSNPTGSVYSKSELEEIGKIVLENDLYVISDEIYSRLVYDDFEFVSFPSLSPELKKKTILIDGVSKAYSMTGWRIGFTAADKELISGMGKLQSQMTSNPCSISQYAALEAITGPQEDVEEMRKIFAERREFLYNALNEIPGVKTANAKGAFYLFPDFSSFFGKSYNGTKIKGSFDLAMYLISEGQVATVPGSVFGAEEFIRIAYATSMENLVEGISRIKKAVAKLQ